MKSQKIHGKQIKIFKKIKGSPWKIAYFPLIKMKTMRGADFLFLLVVRFQIVRNAAVGQNAGQAFAVGQKSGGCSFDIVACAKILVVQKR